MRQLLVLLTALFALGCEPTAPAPIVVDDSGAADAHHHFGAIPPYGPAACDAGAGCVQGTFPNGLKVGPAPTRTVKILESRDGGVVWADSGLAPGSVQVTAIAPCDAGETIVTTAGVQACKLATGTGTVTSVTGTNGVTVTNGTTTPIVGLSQLDGGESPVYAADGGWRGVAQVQQVSCTSPLLCSGTNPAAFSLGTVPATKGGTGLSANGTAGQILQENAAPTPTWTTLSQDCAVATGGAVTCTQLQAGAITAATTGNLTCSGSATNCGMTSVTNSGLNLWNDSNVGGLALISGASSTQVITLSGGNGTGYTYVANGGGSFSSTGALPFTFDCYATQSHCGLTEAPGSVIGTTSAVIVEGQANTGSPGTAGAAELIGGPETTTSTGTNTAGVALVMGGASTTTSGTGIGGAAQMYGGPGSTTNGIVQIGLAAAGGGASTDVVKLNLPTGNEVTAEVDVTNGQNVCIGSSSAAVASGTNTLAIVGGTAPTSCNQNACLYSVSTGLDVMDSSAHITTIGNGITCDPTQSSCGIAQSSTSSTAANLSITAQSSTLVGGTGGKLILTSGNDSTTGGTGGTIIINTPGGGSGGSGGHISLQMGGSSEFLMEPPSSGTANVEFDISGGNNFVIGEGSPTLTAGTNLIGMEHGTAAASCAVDICLETGSAAIGTGLAMLGHNGSSTIIAPDVTGTVNSQTNSITRYLFDKRTTGISQTVQQSISVLGGTGVSIDAICIARTTTAGTTGSVGDMGKIHIEGLVSNPSGTAAVVGTTTTISSQQATSAPIASCTLGVSSGNATVTGTSASNGYGLVLDWELYVTVTAD